MIFGAVLGDERNPAEAVPTHAMGRQTSARKPRDRRTSSRNNARALLSRRGNGARVAFANTRPDAIWPKLSLAQCSELAEQNANGFDAIIESSDEVALEGAITYKNSTGAQFTSELEDILIHVALHGMYHRGQIAAGVRSGGDVPASTDYITMVRGVPTATKQS